MHSISSEPEHYEIVCEHSGRTYTLFEPEVVGGFVDGVNERRIASAGCAYRHKVTSVVTQVKQKPNRKP